MSTAQVDVINSDPRQAVQSPTSLPSLSAHTRWHCPFSDQLGALVVLFGPICFLLGCIHYACAENFFVCAEKNV